MEHPDSEGVIEFFVGEQVVGYFKGPTLPTAAGDYAYEPYRGPGHLELVQRMAAGQPVVCTYFSGGERVTFTAHELLNYGMLRLDGFVRQQEVVGQAAPTGAWEDLQQVLSGTLRPGIDAQAAKMLDLVLLAPCDVELGRESFDLWYASNGRKHRYALELMGPVALDLMTSLGLTELRRAVGGVPGGYPFGSVVRNTQGLAVWLVPADSCCRIHVRESPESVAPGRAQLTVGLWSTPTPVRRRAPQRVPAAKPCPNCGNHPERFRMLSDEQALVCEACGRSFQAG